MVVVDVVPVLVVFVVVVVNIVVLDVVVVVVTVSTTEINKPIKISQFGNYNGVSQKNCRAKNKCSW